MNVIQLESNVTTSEVRNQRDPSNNQNQNWSVPTIRNPDGGLPDVGLWNSGSSTTSDEPVHEFTHLQGERNSGINGAGTNGSDLVATGGGAPNRMSLQNFNYVIGQTARQYRDWYVKNAAPGRYTPARTKPVCCR